ncbi:hypothetical protein [Streptomyces hyaluromycini]|nr:hypothetical protein [Streptomyces hyaluromycini]
MIHVLPDRGFAGYATGAVMLPGGAALVVLGILTSALFLRGPRPGPR